MGTVLLTLAAPGAGLTASDYGWLTAGALAFAAGYALACWWWPWTACRRREGKGRFRSPSGKNWRKYPRRKGSAAQGAPGAAGLGLLRGQEVDPAFRLIFRCKVLAAGFAADRLG